MGLWESIRLFFTSPANRRKQRFREPPLPPPEQGRDLDELGRRLGMSAEKLAAFAPAYRQFTIPKRTGGTRTITAPDQPTKVLQRRILRRLLSRLPAHPAAMGFEKGQSIVTHALGHAVRAVVVRMDIRDFFPSISEQRVLQYFRRIGWNHAAAVVIARLCTYQGSLPQGAPTSPRLSNLINYRLDVRLSAMAAKFAQVYRNPKTLQIVDHPASDEVGVHYSRYADDLTFSFDLDDHGAVESVIWLTQRIVEDEGYRLHTKKKLRIMRRHDRQMVTGLVVNERVGLPRRRRQWLRAVEHHLACGKAATLNEAQVQGWRNLEHMIQVQTAGKS